MPHPLFRPPIVRGTRAAGTLLVLALAATGAGGAAVAPLPGRLSQTGLYVGGDPARIAPAHLAFSPQYPLWSDGTRKQRWLSLPPGAAIDATDPNAWDYPAGTRLWKTFGYERPVETRMIERLADGTWRFSAYVWDADGRDAALAPPEGVTLEVASAPGGRYVVPSRDDCRACHEGSSTPVLGLGLLQLSSDRDPGAPHATPGTLDLGTLVRLGKLTGLPGAALATPPRLAAATPEARAALGYLYGNCAHCHNRSRRGVPVALDLAAQWRGGALDVATVEASMRGRLARYAGGAAMPAHVLTPGDPAASLLVARMRSRDPRLQMPPLGTRSVDAAGLALVERWISQQLPKEIE